MPRIAQNRQEVVNAAVAYFNAINIAHGAGSFPADARQSLINTLSLTQNWITFTRGDDLIVAPFKFCGNVRNNGDPLTPELYHQHRQKLGGTSASNLIGDLFFDGGGRNWPAPQGPRVSRMEIERIAKLNGKELRAVCNIYELPGESLEPRMMQKVEFLAEQIQQAKLPPEAIEALIGRIAA